ncbi:hypothetical protein FOL46_001750 [Perkinsus olseni]|uniref:Uncharacterized protein n=1 Tax=Perkinsus olseni TaxID=32597 RepID=A0A7J6KQ81_PEROL|nr:hypothetical protein FOL46_001750 [Perkinsus olseni]
MSPPNVITPEQHYTWASSQNFQLDASFELPTMLQATVAIQRCLSPQELNWVRQHNIQALQVWVSDLPTNYIPPRAASHWNINAVSASIDLTNYADRDIEGRSASFANTLTTEPPC